MKPLIRVWHPYFLWEEVKYNMWGSVENEKKMIGKCVEFMDDTEKFSSYMQRVVNEWQYSCEHNLTQSGMNQIAFIGQSACALALNCPANTTKKAWWGLTKEKRDAADKEALKAIKVWRKNYEQKLS